MVVKVHAHRALVKAFERKCIAHRRLGLGSPATHTAGAWHGPQRPGLPHLGRSSAVGRWKPARASLSRARAAARGSAGTRPVRRDTEPVHVPEASPRARLAALGRVVLLAMDRRPVDADPLLAGPVEEPMRMAPESVDARPRDRAVSLTGRHPSSPRRLASVRHSAIVPWKSSWSSWSSTYAPSPSSPHLAIMA